MIRFSVDEVAPAQDRPPTRTAGERFRHQLLKVGFRPRAVMGDHFRGGDGADAIEWSANGVLLERHGNRSPYAAPQGVYPALEPDWWVALSIETDDEWARLRLVLGDPEWARDSRFATAAGRHARGHCRCVQTGQRCGVEYARCGPQLLEQHRRRDLKLAGELGYARLRHRYAASLPCSPSRREGS